MTAATREDVGHCSCFALRRASRRVTQLFDHHMAAAGLRVTQFSMLVQLAKRGPLSIQVLADAMVLDRTTLARNLKPLERDGLVAVEVDPKDRRGRIVRLTDAGEARWRDAQGAWARAQTAFEQGYGADNAKALFGMLRGVSAGSYGVPPAAAGVS